MKKVPVKISPSSSISHRVKMAHSLSEVIAGLGETAQRVIVAAASQAARTQDPKVSMSICDIINSVGGSKKLYDIVKSTAKEISQGVFLLAENADEEYFMMTNIVKNVSYSKGLLTLSFTEDALKEIVNVQTRFTLLHLHNIKKLTGEIRVGLYILLSAWDQTGEYITSARELSEKLKTETPLKRVSLFFNQTIKPFEKQMRDKLGIELITDLTGKGFKAVFSFRWHPKAFRKAAGDFYELPGIDVVDKEAEKRIHAEVLLRVNGVMDPKMSQRLILIPADKSVSIIQNAVKQGLTKGLLRDTVVARIMDEIEKQNEKEQARLRAESRKVIDAEIVAEKQEEINAVQVWLEKVPSEILVATAKKLDPIAQRHYLKDVDANNGEQIREAAKKLDFLGGFLAMAAGVLP